MWRRCGGGLVVGSLVLFGVGVAPAAAEPPVNDGVDGAVVVTGLPYSGTFDASGATRDADDAQVERVCGGLATATHSVWFSFTPADDTEMRGWAYAGTWDRRVNLAVVTGDSGSLQVSTCSLDSIYARTIGLAAGTRYLIRVSLSDAALPAGTSGELSLYSPQCGVDSSDFDGNGCQDLTVGVPGAGLAIDNAVGAGAVDVLYGDGVNLASRRRQRLVPGRALGVPVEAGSGFGTSLSVGALNEDQFDDLAIGIPRLDAGTAVDAGAVLVLFGGPDGLGERRLLLRQGDLPGSGRAESGDRFGSTVLIGSDRQLFVGAPGEGIGAADGAGAVVAFRGLAEVGTSPSARLISQAGAVAGAAEAGDHFGSALWCGSDGVLLVGVPGEDIGGVVDAGAVIEVLPSGASTQFSQDTPGMGGVAEAGDRFGSSIQFMSGRIAIGAPGEDVGHIRDAGMINFLYALFSGSRPRPSIRVLTQDSPGVPGKAERGDRFGSVLAVPYRAVGQPERLLVGVPDEDLGTLVDAGAVWSLSFSTRDPTWSVTGRVWTQASQGVPGTPESGDRLGASLATLSELQDAIDNQTVYAGAPGEDVFGVPDTGFVEVLGGRYPSTRVMPLNRQPGQRLGAALQPGRPF
jgi:hypothetical protein